MNHNIFKGTRHVLKEFRSRPRDLIVLVQKAIEQFNSHHAPQLAAAMSFFAIFSLAPLLIIAIAIISVIFGQTQARSSVYNTVTGLVGPEAGKFVVSTIEGIRGDNSSIFATILSLLAIILGAAGIFGQIKAMLRIIWNVPNPPSKGLRSDILLFLREQVLYVLLVLLTAGIMVVSIAFSAVSAAAVTVAGQYVSVAGELWPALSGLISFFVIALLFGAAYRYLPGIKIHWGDVFPGAILTSLLFALGRALIGLYLGRSSVTSAYGAAGSLVVLLLWINYTATILFLGAEITQVYAVMFGSLQGTGKAAEIEATNETLKREQNPLDAEVAKAAATSPAKPEPLLENAPSAGTAPDSASTAE